MQTAFAKRLFDLFVSIPLLVLSLPVQGLVWAIVKATSSGPGLHKSRRIGQFGEEFVMLKFRTMYIETPDVATHLLTDSASHITRVGRVLRNTSLDELPQLWNVVRGEMSLVGPRPALHTQDDLFNYREEVGVNAVKPGITGLAQVEGRDELSIEEKVQVDSRYISSQSLKLDAQILFKTVTRVIQRTSIEEGRGT